jgi:uracil-DNA glycosylase family 4
MPTCDCPWKGPQVPGAYLRKSEECGSPVWLVLGMNPGKQELREGAPFVGPSGRLLRPLLLRLIPEGTIYLTNAIACGAPSPGAVHLAACAPRCAEEIETLKPQFILLLGKVAEQMYKRMVLPWPHRVEAAPHPATVVRRVLSYQNWADQLMAAVVRLRGDPAIPLLGGPSDLTIAAIDTEYKRDAHSGAEIAVLVTLRGDALDAHTFSDALGNWRELEERLRGVDELVMHHAVNDLVALDRRGVRISSVDCTQTAQGVLRPGASRNLKTLAALNGYPYHSINMTAWKTGRADVESVTAYCRQDAEATLRLWLQDLRGHARHVPLYVETYKPLLPVLASMSRIRVDMDRLNDEIVKAESRVLALEKTLAERAAINWYSSRQVADWLLAQGVELPPTEMAAPSTGEEALTSLFSHETVGDVAKTLLQLRAESKILTTYLYRWREDGEVRTIYDPTGASKTGRMSSRDTNVQNIPDALRFLLLPPEGCRWVGADLSQHEVRVAAWLSGDPTLRREIASGDVHGDSARRVLGRALADDSERRMWKAVQFSLLYIGLPPTLQRHVESLGQHLSDDQAQDIWVRWWEAHPGYLAWVDSVRGQASLGLVPSPLGRVYKTRYPKTLEDLRSIVNALIQGVASDLCARGLLRAARAGLQPLVVVHDYVAVAAPVGEEDEAAEALVKAMTDDPLCDLLAVKVKVGDRWDA